MKFNSFSIPLVTGLLLIDVVHGKAQTYHEEKGVEMQHSPH